MPANDPEATRRELAYLLTHPASEEQKPPPLSEREGEVDRHATDLLTHRAIGGVQLRRMAGVTPQRVEWLWPGRIPFGKLTIIDGHPGQGKSTLTMALIAACSTGETFPGRGPAVPFSSILLSAEDGVEDTIAPRLMAHGADMERVAVLESVLTDDPDYPERPWRLPDDLDRLRYAVGALDARLVVIDPLMAFLAGKIDSHRDQDVRRALHPLSILAEDTGAAVVIVRHLTKSGAGPAVTRGGGSVGISGAARSVLVVATDPQDPAGERRIVASAKSNLGAPPSALAFYMDPDPDYGCAHLSWVGESHHTAETVLAHLDAEDVSEVGRAAEWLKSALGEAPIPVGELLPKARQAGIQDKHLAKARRLLGLAEILEGPTVYWQLSS